MLISVTVISAALYCTAKDQQYTCTHVPVLAHTTVYIYRHFDDNLIIPCAVKKQRVLDYIHCHNCSQFILQYRDMQC